MPAKVQQLRPSRERSPERARLAEAIARHTSARAYLGRLSAARGRIRGQLGGLLDAVEKAEAELAKAREAESADLAEKFLSGKLDDSPAKTADAAEALDLVRRAEEKTRLTALALAAEEAEAEREVERARHALNAAVAAVVAPSAALAGLFAEYDEAKKRIATAWATLRLVARRHALLPGQYRRLNEIAENLIGAWPVDEATVERWAAALDELTSNPDAVLPGDDPPAATPKEGA